MAGARSGHSRIGVASFVLSFFPGLLFVGYTLLLAYSAGQEPVQGRFLPDDGAGYAIMGFLLTSAILLSELLGLGLGIAGAAQRERKRTFAFLGMACAILVFAFAFGQDVFPLF